MNDREPTAVFPDAPPLLWWRERTNRLVSYRCGRGRRCRRLLAEVFETPGGAVVHFQRHAPDRQVHMAREVADQRESGEGAGSIKKFDDGSALLRGDGAHPGWVVALDADTWWADIVSPACARHGALPGLSRSDLAAATRRARASGAEEALTLS